MRALCGAIITAGALIGLGLVAIGVGLRYQSYPYRNQSDKAQWVEIKHLDTALVVVLGALVLSLVVGMVVSFLGLAYHHHRRHHEYLLAMGKAGHANGHHVAASV